MKARYCTGITLLIVLLMVGIYSARTLQVNAAMPGEGLPGEPWTTGYISTSPNAGTHVSIAIDEDNSNIPWVAYYNQTYGSLMVAHYVGAGNGDCYPNDAWMCVQVDQEHYEYRGLYTSIDVYPDTDPDPSISTWKVGVSYYDATNKTLKYAEYTCPPLNDCAWTIQTVDSSSDAADSVGKYTSLKFAANGVANISYNIHDDMGDAWKEGLKYAYYTGVSSCGDNPGWYCEEIDTAYLDASTLYGAYTSLDIAWNHTVYISYYDGFNGLLKYTHYVGGGGNCAESHWDCQFIDVGKFSAMHAQREPGDIVSVAYYNQTTGTLMYGYDIEGYGNCGEGTGWQCDAIEPIGEGMPQVGISLAVDEKNNPLIAYTDGYGELAPLDLKIASPASDRPYANCGGGPSYDWWCRTLAYGDPYLNEGEFLGLGIKSNGLAMVAYSEEDSYLEEIHLKITSQTTIMTLLPLVVK